LTPRNTSPKTVEPIRMNITKHDSRVVPSSAWRSSLPSRCALRQREQQRAARRPSPRPPSASRCRGRSCRARGRSARRGGTSVAKTRRSSLRRARGAAPPADRAGAAAGFTIDTISDVRRRKQPVSSSPGTMAPVHVADRPAELVGHHDQDERRRDDLRERAGRRDHAGRELLAVAVPQHDRQRDQAHRDDRRGHDAGRRGEQRTDENHRDRRARRASVRTAGRWCRADPRPCPIVRGSAP
jgi:hypothetical protein